MLFIDKLYQDDRRTVLPGLPSDSIDLIITSPEYCWHKKNCCPGKWPNRFRDAWERCLHFTRQKKFAMYQDEVMVPVGDWAQILGSGTTAIVAQRMGRRCIGIEALPRYFEMAQARLGELAVLPAGVT